VFATRGLCRSAAAAVCLTCRLIALPTGGSALPRLRPGRLWAAGFLRRSLAACRRRLLAGGRCCTGAAVPFGNGDQFARLAGLLDQRQHLPAFFLRNGNDRSLGGSRSDSVVGGGAQYELVIARVERFIEHDGEIASGTALRLADHRRAG